VCGHTSSPATLLGGRNMDEKRSEMRASEERMAEGGWAGRVHGVGWPRAGCGHEFGARAR